MELWKPFPAAGAVQEAELGSRLLPLSPSEEQELHFQDDFPFFPLANPTSGSLPLLLSAPPLSTLLSHSSPLAKAVLKAQNPTTKQTLALLC